MAAAQSGSRRLLLTCGNGDRGQLGLGAATGATTFQTVLGLLDVDVAAASCGNAHTAAVSTCGTLYTFGSNDYHQLGHSAGVTAVPVPQEVELRDACASAASGGAFTLAVSESGEVWGAPHCVGRSSSAAALRSCACKRAANVSDGSARRETA